MKALFSALLCLLPFAIAFAGDPVVGEGPLPPIFVPRVEQPRPANSILAAPTTPHVSPVSDRMRAILAARIAQLPQPTSTSLLDSTGVGPVMMEKFVVNAPRVITTPHRDDPPLWRFIQTGVFYQHTTPGGLETQVDMKLVPVMPTGGARHEPFTRIEFAFRFKW